ncbi:MAG: D-aminoacyl-tRNA deacylase [Oscillospiraceae bacterium]|nr:D-aminoacyl-tRNA deacylase [Oscillospiraceae bacterium]
MRAVVQRVARSAVVADGELRGEIGQGLCIFVGVGKDDGDWDVEWLAGKILGLRVFSDGDGKMNLNVSQVGGSLLIVSQFTLYGDCRKGMRPSYDAAMPTDRARGLYDAFTERCALAGLPVVSGVFQADMAVTIENDGPVTLLLDSKKAF